MKKHKCTALILVGIFPLLVIAFLFNPSSPHVSASSSNLFEPGPSRVARPPQIMTSAAGGSWDSFFTTKDVPVHISLLPDGRLLYWGRDKAVDNYDIGDTSQTYVLDPLYLDNPAYTATVAPNPTTNLFCSGHSFLPDGRLLVAGGHGKATDASTYPAADPAYSWVEGVGEKDINIFDYRSSTWIRMPPSKEMEKGRWYPFNVTLANGETLIMSGTYWDGVTLFGTNPNRRPRTFINAEPSIRDLQGNIRTLRGDGTFDLTQFYPYLSLTTDGKVFNAKPGPTLNNGGNFSHLLDPYAQNGSGNFGVFTSVGRPDNDHWEGTSLMYEPGKVLILGGSQTGLGGMQSNLAEAIDLTQPAPQWHNVVVGQLTYARQYPTGTLLPDGKALVTGGTNCAGFNALNCGPNMTYGGAVQTPELWDSANPSLWQQMNSTTSNVPRVYHSVALLLPDARVLVGGGGLPAAAGERTADGTLCTGGGPQDPLIDCRKLGHNNVELFSPPYLFNSDGTRAVRPAIFSAPESISYNQDFLVNVGNVAPSSIQNVVLIRLPSVTHTYNQDQRRVDLGPPVSSDSTFIRVRSPANGNLCPPGPYMMFLISNNGRNTPSIAKIVRVGDFAVNREFPSNGASQSFTATSPDAAPLGGKITVTSPQGVVWTANSSASWLKIASIINGSDASTKIINFTVDPNTAPNAANRVGAITINVPGREAFGLDYLVYQAINFSDVQPTSPYNKFISALYARGITAGCGAGNFCPDATINRGQVAVFLSVILAKPSVAIPEPVAGASGYPDILDNNPLRRFIAYIKRRGIPDSCAGGNFCQNQAVTRREMVVWSLRATGITNPPLPPVPTFSDVPFSDPSAPFIEEAFRRGLTAGCGGGRFCPNDTITRGTMAVFLTQAFGL